jgi:hypothetical protein
MEGQHERELNLHVNVVTSYSESDEEGEKKKRKKRKKKMQKKKRKQRKRARKMLSDSYAYDSSDEEGENRVRKQRSVEIRKRLIESTATLWKFRRQRMDKLYQEASAAREEDARANRYAKAKMLDLRAKRLSQELCVTPESEDSWVDSWDDDVASDAGEVENNIPVQSAP